MTDTPLREVNGNELTSTHLPTTRVRVSDEMPYIGALRMILSSIAEAEIFTFGEADDARRLKRWLVVQFEGFLGNNSYTYNYDMPERVTLGEHEYMVDYFAAHLPTFMAGEPEDSDAAQEMVFMRELGYSIPDDVIWVRFVRVIGEDRRRELLFIYTEDLSTLGLTAAPLGANGPLPTTHAGLAREVRQRAIAAFTVVEG